MPKGTPYKCRVVWCTKMPDLTPKTHTLFYLTDDTYVSFIMDKGHVFDLQNGMYYADINCQMYTYERILTPPYTWSYAFQHRGLTVEFDCISGGHVVLCASYTGIHLSEIFVSPVRVSRMAVLHYCDSGVIVRCDDSIVRINIDDN